MKLPRVTATVQKKRRRKLNRKSEKAREEEVLRRNKWGASPFIEHSNVLGLFG
jgi:hypothetical protein